MRFLCGPRRPTDADQALIDEFGSWLEARAQQPRMVTRPQDCDCGASQVAMVAHGVNCKSRTRRTPLATPTPLEGDYGYHLREDCPNTGNCTRHAIT